MLLRNRRAVIAMMQLRNIPAVLTAAHSSSSSSSPQLCPALTPAAQPLSLLRLRIGTPRVLHQTTAAAAAARARERSVRAKAQQGEVAAAAAAAARDTEDVLDALYAQAEVAAEAAQTTATTSPAPADADDLLDALYGDAAAAAESPKPAAAAAAAAGAPEQPQSSSLLDTLYGDAAATGTSGSSRRGAGAATAPVVAAAAAAAAAAADEGGSSASAAKQQQQQQSSPTNSAGGGNSSGRAPPTQVVKPDLPSDLSVFSNAVLLVDKPKEWTSFDACNAIKGAIKRLGVKKIGHAGTLDPAATGLLIICTGAGTKSIEGFMAAHKEYSGTLKLGEGTPSLDAETEVDERLAWEHITDEQLQEAAKKLTGNIEQVPPMYSALHHQGQRLHELARAGVTVERPARPVTITRFDVHRDPDDKQLVHFYVGCTKGTYIRTLGHDLATSLGTTGHLVALRREAIGDARVDQAWEVQTLVDKLFAAIREQSPEAFKEGDGNSKGGKRGGRGRGRGGRGGKKQQQTAQQPPAEQ